MNQFTSTEKPQSPSSSECGAINVKQRRTIRIIKITKTQKQTVAAKAFLQKGTIVFVKRILSMVKNKDQKRLWTLCRCWWCRVIHGTHMISLYMNESNWAYNINEFEKCLECNEACISKLLESGYVYEFTCKFFF